MFVALILQQCKSFRHLAKPLALCISSRASASSVADANEKNNLQQQKRESSSRLEKATPKYISYLRLIRADKPIGVWLLYWPCTWSIALSSAPGHLPDVQLLALFGAGAFLMRSAGCVLNDLWDQEYDKKVERTKDRPLASGAVSEKEAVLILTGLLSASLSILLQFNWLSVLIGACAVPLVATYPLAKRYTNWPQLVLGATFNWGAILGFTAASGHFSPEICLPLYLACINWTMVYDTIYAHQDKRDDLLIGVGSTALQFGGQTRQWLSAFSFGMVANLALVGLASEQTWPFYVGLTATAVHLCTQIVTLRPDDPADCWKKFLSNRWLGPIIFAGIVLGNLLKRRREDGGSEDAEEFKSELEQLMEGTQKRNLSVNFYT